jgi:uncharacterized protein (TIGR00369 family)
MSNFEPPDPDFRKRVEESFKSQKFMEFIGAELTKVEPGFCVIKLPYKKELTQQDGFFHAGIMGTLADNAGGYAAFTLMDQKASLLSVEFKMNLLAPAEGDTLIAKSRVIKPGRSFTICSADIFSIKDGKEKLCATALMTMFQKL